MSDPESRCFWITLRETPPGVERRAFVALCSGANLTGNPEDCDCDSWPQRVATLQAQVHAERLRAERAEAALERERLRIRDVLRRAGRDRMGNRLPGVGGR